MHLLHLIISGRVQDVGYRWFVRREAGRLGITGYAKNLNDGTVEVVAYGERDVLKQLQELCGQGPRAARVNNIHIEWRDTDAVPDGFEIK